MTDFLYFKRKLGINVEFFLINYFAVSLFIMNFAKK